MMLKIYRILNIIITPVLVLWLFYRAFRKKEDYSRIKERFGTPSKKRPANKELIWIHAASVGETVSVLQIINILSHNSKYSILFTSGTVTSAKLIQNKLPKNVIHQFIPVENYFAIRKFLNYWQPKLSIFVESEFWPCILYETSKISKLISLNTKISDSSFKGWNNNKSFFNEIAKLFSLFIPQSLADQKKLKALGVTNSKYIGNLKYTVPALETQENKLTALKDALHNRKVVLFASTHPKEEELILNIYRRLKVEHESLIFIIAPRHPHRSADIVSMIESFKYKIAVRSKRHHIKPDTDFYLCDTIGELGTLFRASPISVVCGTFTNIGGHNPIEPAKLKSAVIIGPDISGIKEISAELKKNKAAIFVKNHIECAKAINLLLSSKVTHKKYVINALTFLNTKNSILRDTMLKIREYLK